MPVRHVPYVRTKTFEQNSWTAAQAYILPNNAYINNRFQPMQKSRPPHTSPAGPWYLSSRVHTWPKPSDFSGEKILSMPSFGGEVKPSVPCHSFAACKKSLTSSVEVVIVRLNLIGHFSPILPLFTNRGLSCHLTWSASGDDGGN
jgi:hypothetical protein